MGPWTHSVLTDKAGDLTFPNAQRPPNNVQDPMPWFDYYLKGMVNGVAELPAVTYYVMGDVSVQRAWQRVAHLGPLAASPGHGHSAGISGRIKRFQRRGSFGPMRELHF